MLRDARASCVYEGTVGHRRRGAVKHAFRYRLSLVLLDLAELPHLQGLAPLWGCEKPAPVTFRRRDYFGDPSIPLETAVRDLVESRTHARPDGPIRLLTSPRLFGYAFNPISLFFCYDAEGETVEHVVAEVTNTPWHERHCYVLPVPRERRGQSVQHFETAKELHVSPFLPMEQEYRWRIELPGEQLSVRITNHENGECVFGAEMALVRRPMTRASLVRGLAAVPLAAFGVTAGIYFQALRLWWKGATYHPHPCDSTGAARAPGTQRLADPSGEPTA